MNKTRTGHVIKNTWVGFANRFICMLISFVVRTAFIKILGPEYLGVDGLFSNILIVLSLTELGVGNVLTFSLYKPVAENDIQVISRLLAYYKHIYRYVVIGIVFFGLALLPFLSYLVNSSFDKKDIITFYLIYLFNSVISYLGVCYVLLIKAAQKQYIIDTITSIMKFIFAILQLIVIIKYRNFFFFIFLMVLNTASINFLAYLYSKKDYNILKTAYLINEKDRNIIIQNIKSSFLYKMGVVIVNNTDNVLISVIISTVCVGYYSNYSLIVFQFSALMNILCTALIASIGNMSVENDKEKSYAIFRKLVCAFHYITMIVAVVFLLVLDDFVKVWIGKENSLGQVVVFAISISFYVQNVINPVWMYREAYGLFEQIKYLMLLTAAFNLLFSIIGGLLFGLAGIIGATALARIFTTVWYEPRILFKHVFERNCKEYYLQQFKYIIETTIIGFSIYRIDRLVNWNTNGIMQIIMRTFLIVIIGTFLFVIINIKSEEMKYWCAFVKKTFINHDKQEN